MATARLAALFLLFAISSACAQPQARPESALRTPSGRLLGWDGRALPGRALGQVTTAHVARPGAAGVGTLDGRWNELGPPVRLVPEMIHDAAHDRLVVFGGVSGLEPSGYRYVDDTWVLDLAGTPEWKRLEVAGPRPEPRAGHGAAYDAARHRLVIFGGFRFVVRDDGSIDFRYMSDAWALNLDGVPHWEQLATLGPQPDPRSGAALVYDGARDRVLTVGGFNSSPDDDGTYYDEIWALDLGRPHAAWALLPATPGGPEPRAFGLAARDEATDRLVLFGGQSASGTSFVDGYHRDVWTLGLAAGGAWEPLDPPGPLPPLRYGEASAFDPRARRISLFGGVLVDSVEGPHLLDDFWSLDLAGVRWAQGESAEKPLARENASLACDGSGDPFLFSGDTELQAGLADTWQWSYATSGWVEHGPGAPPIRRVGTAAAFDETSRTVVAFGGGWTDFNLYPYEGPFFAFDDLVAWSVDRGSWSPLAAQGTAPSPRSDAATAFDAARRRLWIVGGTSAENQAIDDTWALELAGGPHWRAVPVAGPHPSGRDAASAIFDAQDDRVLLYGGRRGEGEDEVWQLADDTWSLLAVEGSIPARTGAMAVYDPKRHRMIVLGGAWYDKFDSWALSLDAAPTWTRIDGAGPTPPPGAGARAVYDPQADRILVFGGIDSGDFFATDANVYELSLADPPTWRRLAPGGQAALPRAEHLAFFDAARNRLLVTGGWDGFSSQGGSFELSFASPAVTVALDVRPGSASDALPARSRGPLPVALLSAPDFDPAQVDIASLRLEGAPARVPGRPSADWNVDGTTDLLVEFDSGQMQPHGERLALTGALLDGTPIEGSALVSLRPGRAPEDAALDAALSIRASGTPGTMRFTASLPRAGAWNLDLFDVRGRRIAGATGVAAAAGAFPVELSCGAPSGVYFVRLRTGDAATHTRFAWARP